MTAFLAAHDALEAILAELAPFTGQVPDGIPVTIAWGTKDRLLRPPQVLVAKARLPQARIRPLPGCGHVPMTDDPALVADVLLQGSGRLTRPARRGRRPARPDPRCRDGASRVPGTRQGAVLRSRERQAHLEPGVPGYRLGPQVAVVPVHHDPPRDVEPETGALADRLGGEERLEDPLPDVVRDAGAGVGELHQQPVALHARCGW